MKKDITIKLSNTIQGSNNFEIKLKKLLPIEVKEIFIDNVGMYWKGYGTYQIKMIVEINGTDTVLSETTHDSMMYDYYKDLEYQSRAYNNWVKGMILRLIENSVEAIECDLTQC